MKQKNFLQSNGILKGMVILFDIGGSRMRFARSDTLQTFTEPIIVDTPPTYEDAIVEAAQIIGNLAKGESITAIVGGIAGAIDVQKGTLHASPNMRAWIGKTIIKDLERLTGAKRVVLKNDADLAALGEAVAGAGKGYQYVAYLTISTGVGGAFVANQTLLETRYGTEPGHQIINEQTGETLEEVVGGRQLEKKYGKKPKDLGKAVYDELAKRLAVGVHNIIQLWSPDVVVLGGSQMRDISISTIHQEVTRRNVMFPYVPDITVSTLGSINGIHGALAYAQKLFLEE